VLPEGCGDANPGLANCSDSRGQTFARNASSSWSTQRLSNGGLFQLNTFEESYLGLTGNGYYGFDTVSLGSGIPTLQNQLIAGIGTNSYWLGSLGLSPLGFNITTLNDPIPSLLSNLRNESLVPSQHDPLAESLCITLLTKDPRLILGLYRRSIVPKSSQLW